MLFLDVEGFQHGCERFIPKEMCILSSDNPEIVFHFVFQPPTPWSKLSIEQQRTYSYQFHRLHTLGWHEGSIPYCKACVLFYITQNIPNYKREHFVVFGKEKLRFLRVEFPELKIHMFPNVTLNTLPKAPYYIYCPYRKHGHFKHCSALKCYRLYLLWLHGHY